MKKLKRWQKITIIIVGLLLVHSIASMRIAGPLKGKVIDAQTGEPIKGALVRGIWTAKVSDLFIDYRWTAYRIDNDYTDKNGIFSIPAAITWRPFPFYTYGNREIQVFAHGYYMKSGNADKSLFHVSLFKGNLGTVKLEQLDTAKDWFENFNHLISSFDSHFRYQNAPLEEPLFLVKENELFLSKFMVKNSEFRLKMLFSLSNWLTSIYRETKNEAYKELALKENNKLIQEFPGTDEAVIASQNKQEIFKDD